MIYWFAYKKHFIKNNENIICIQNTYIKINKQHSNNLENNQKIKVSINKIFKLEKEEAEYYLVYNDLNNNLNNNNINNTLIKNKNEMLFYTFCVDIGRHSKNNLVILNIVLTL